MSYFVIRRLLVHQNVDPDRSSITGDSVRVIGYSQTADEQLTVVVAIRDKRLIGSTAWKTSKREQRIYWSEG